MRRGAGRPVRAGADAARPHHAARTACRSNRPRWRAEAQWALRNDRGLTYAASPPNGVAHRRRRMVAGRLPRPAAGLVRRRAGARHGAQGRRHADRQPARPRDHRRRSPICARSNGRGSASISRSCSRPARSKRRRRPISPPSMPRRPRRSASAPQVTERFPERLGDPGARGAGGGGAGHRRAIGNAVRADRAR